MKNKNILVFGSTGFIGRSLMKRLLQNGDKLICPVRNANRVKRNILSGDIGQIEIIEFNIHNLEEIKSLIANSDLVINLIGILYEKKRNSFKNIHTLFPSVLAKLCKKNNFKNLIHLSAVGINDATDSYYAKSTLDGEKEILKNFPLSTILRPSVVYSVDDNFTTNFMTLLNRLPLFPLYYNGQTKFMPIHSSDLVDIIYNIISKNIYSQIIECVGPETLSFKEIIEKLLYLIDKRRILLPVPLFFGKLTAKFFQLFPKPLLTEDQLRLLKYDNISSGKYKTNIDIGFPAKRLFEEEVEKYCYMWKQGGEYSKKNTS